MPPIVFMYDVNTRVYSVVEQDEERARRTIEVIVRKVFREFERDPNTEETHARLHARIDYEVSWWNKSICTKLGVSMDDLHLQGPVHRYSPNQELKTFVFVRLSDVSHGRVEFHILHYTEQQAAEVYNRIVAQAISSTMVKFSVNPMIGQLIEAHNTRIKRLDSKDWESEEYLNREYEFAEQRLASKGNAFMKAVREEGDGGI